MSLLILDRKPISPLRFAWRTSNKAFDLAFLITLVIWSVQELWIRDLFLPEENYKTTHHLLEMLSVVWGAYFTGYIFFWLINHIPEARKKYAAQSDLELSVLHIFYRYRSLMVGLMMEGTRTGSEEENGWIYRMAIEEEHQPDFFPSILQRREPLDDTDPVSEEGQFTDRCGMMIAFAYRNIHAMTQDILDLKAGLDHEFVDVIELIHETECAEDPDGDEDTRRVNIINLSDALEPLYQHMEQKIKRGDFIDPRIPKLIEKNTFRDLWEEAGDERKKEVNIDLMWYPKPAPRTVVPNAPEHSAQG